VNRPNSWQSDVFRLYLVYSFYPLKKPTRLGVGLL
jgi:hypothetical protein